jgi:hypothetical protein
MDTFWFALNMKWWWGLIQSGPVWSNTVHFWTIWYKFQLVSLVLCNIWYEKFLKIVSPFYAIFAETTKNFLLFMYSHLYTKIMYPFQSYVCLKLSLCLQDGAACKNVAPQSLHIQDKLSGFASVELCGKGMLNKQYFAEYAVYCVLISYCCFLCSLWSESYANTDWYSCSIVTIW